MSSLKPYSIKANFTSLFLKQLSSSYILYGLNIGLMILVTPFLLEHLGTEPYGIWILCQNLATYFNLFNLGFLSNMVAQYATKTTDSEEAKNKLFSTVFFSLVMFCFLSIPAFWYIYEHFEIIFKITSSNVMLGKKVFSVVYLSFISIFLASTFDMILYYILGNIVTKNIIDICRLLVLNIGYIAIIFLGGGVFEIALFYLSIQILIMITLYAFAKKGCNLHISTINFDYQLFKSFFKPSFNFLLLNLANMIIFAGDNIIISALIGVEQLVIFSLSFKLSDTAIRLINKLVDVKSPMMITYIKTKDYFNLKAEFNKLVYWSLGLSFIAMIFIILCGKLALIYWLGNKYNFDNYVIGIFAVFIMTNSLYYVCWIFLNLTGQHSRLSYVVLLEIVLNIILSYFLGKQFGLIGIALGTLIASICTSGWFAYYECKRYFRNHI